MNTTTLHLKLKPSRQCLLLLLFIYSGPFVIIGALPLPLWTLVILECCLGYSLTRNIKRYAQLKDPSAIKELTYHKERGWTLTTHNNISHPAKLLPNSTLFSWLLVLNFQSINKRKKIHLLVFSDSLPPTLFRQLKVRLKHLDY